MFEIIFIRMFYIVIFFYLSERYIYYSVIFKDSSGYIYRNVLYIMKFIFIRKLYLLQRLTKYWKFDIAIFIFLV